MEGEQKSAFLRWLNDGLSMIGLLWLLSQLLPLLGRLSFFK